MFSKTEYKYYYCSIRDNGKYANANMYDDYYNSVGSEIYNKLLAFSKKILCDESKTNNKLSNDITIKINFDLSQKDDEIVVRICVVPEHEIDEKTYNDFMKDNYKLFMDALEDEYGSSIYESDEYDSETDEWIEGPSNYYVYTGYSADYDE